MQFARVPALIVASAVLAGCAWDLPPVEWSAPDVRAAAGDTLSPVTLGVATPAPVVRGVALPVSDAGPPSAGACPGSVAQSSALGRQWATWWRVRADSSAELMLARRPDSALAWMPPIVIDTLDRARTGCARSAPAITADSVNGYVHIAYYMQSVEGPGVFYAHLMDPRQSRPEVPQAMVYGEGMSRVAVASRGDTVAVVYEDPNSARGRIAMHLSLTGGHLFDQTARLIPVSSGNTPAQRPSVRVDSGRVEIGWRESSPAGASIVRRQARIVSR
jgi:hypothetical protein